MNKGQTSVEYILLIAIIAITSIQFFRTFQNIYSGEILGSLEQVFFSGQNGQPKYRTFNIFGR